MRLRGICPCRQRADSIREQRVRRDRKMYLANAFVIGEALAVKSSPTNKALMLDDKECSARRIVRDVIYKSLENRRLSGLAADIVYGIT